MMIAAVKMLQLAKLCRPILVAPVPWPKYCSYHDSPLMRAKEQLRKSVTCPR